MLDLAQIEENFEIVHPKAEVDERYADVKFYTQPLASSASFSLYENAKKKGGRIDSRFIGDSFVRVCKSWTGVVRDGVDVPCTEEEKRNFMNSPVTSKLAQYILDKTDEMARDAHGIEAD